MAAVVGIDFGTESARAIVVDVRDGRVLGSAVSTYRHGVIDERLPSGTALGAEWALQHPGDWMESLESCVRQALAAASVDTATVIGIGIDFTACTVLPVRADGTPVYGVATEMEGVAPRRIADDRFGFALTFPDLALLPGKYFARAHALDPEGVRLFDHVERAFTVTGSSREMGFVRLPHRWHDAP